MTYYDARAAGKPYLRRVVRDAEGTIIPKVVWCNTATGEVERVADAGTPTARKFRGEWIASEVHPKPLTVSDE